MAGQARQGKRWSGRDLRMRCTTTEAAYTWPNGAPYDGGTPVTWKVPGYDSHAVAGGSRRRARSLCGFSWAAEEGRAVEDLSECRECLREVQLGAWRPRGNW